MALPVQHLESQTQLAGIAEWPLAAVAVKLGVTGQRIRQLCKAEWGPAGLARKDEEGQWVVSAAAHPLLREQRFGHERDLQQEVELAAQGVPRVALDDAKRRREILNGYAAFRMAQPRRVGDRACKVRYLQSLGAEAPSITQFYQWDSAYGADGLRALVDRRKCRASGESSAVGPAALAHIQMILNAGNRIKVAQAIDIARIEAAKHAGDPAWSIPAYRTVLAAVQARRSTIMDVLANKGLRAARGGCVPKMMRDFESIAAGDEYVGDEKTLDVWCRFWTGRKWRALKACLTVWADMRSRVIVGWVLTVKGNSRSILAALKKAIRGYGKPLRLRVDRGKDYVKAGKHGALQIGAAEDDKLPSVMKDFGIEYRHVEGYSPWTKPIESFYHTFKLLHDQLYASFWGGCPSERHEDRMAYLKAHLEKLPTLENIAECIGEAVRLFHHSEHTAGDMFGKTPLAAMEAFREGPVRKESEEVLRHVFQCFVGPKRILRDGVRHEGHWYGHGDARLVALRNDSRRVILAIDPDDASRATLCDLARRPMFEVECYAHRGQTLDQVKEKHRQLRSILKPYAREAQEAREWLVDQDPRAILAARADAAEKRNPAPQQSAPSLTVIRPDLEEAIAKKGVAPSDAMEARERASLLASGTDDAALGVDDLDDLCEPSPFAAPQRDEATDPVEDDL